MKEISRENTLLEIVEFLLKEYEEGLNIHELFKQAATIKGIDLGDVDLLSQLYLDMTMSSKFVYLGDEIWDLKERNLEYWDKENFGYVETEYEDEEDEDDLEFSDYVLEEDDEELLDEDDDEEDEEISKELEEEKDYIEIELPIQSTDDDEDDDPEIIFDDEEEDRYNEVMDDYEDMYD